jgi:hypothetical protein
VEVTAGKAEPLGKAEPRGKAEPSRLGSNFENWACRLVGVLLTVRVANCRRIAAMCGEPNAMAPNRLVADVDCNFTECAVLVRSAEQVHRRPPNRQAEREEPGGAVQGLRMGYRQTF